MKKVKILVTGSTGFVGQQVIKALSLLEVELSLVLRADKSTFYNKNKNITSVIDSKNIFDESDSWWQEKCLGIDLLIHFFVDSLFIDSLIQ